MISFWNYKNRKKVILILKKFGKLKFWKGNFLKFWKLKLLCTTKFIQIFSFHLPVTTFSLLTGLCIIGLFTFLTIVCELLCKTFDSLFTGRHKKRKFKQKIINLVYDPFFSYLFINFTSLEEHLNSSRCLTQKLHFIWWIIKCLSPFHYFMILFYYWKNIMVLPFLF